MNKIFSGLHMNDMTKEKNRLTANKKAAGIIQDMPENVLFGEDSGAILPDEFKNQLDDEIH
jgi:outer membrane protein OmpA-like peptidoglycan-associated protein